MQCIKIYAGGFHARVSDNFISHASAAVLINPVSMTNWITYHIRQICSLGDKKLQYDQK